MSALTPPKLVVPPASRFSPPRGGPGARWALVRREAGGIWQIRKNTDTLHDGSAALKKMQTYTVTMTATPSIRKALSGEDGPLTSLNAWKGAAIPIFVARCFEHGTPAA